MKNKLLSVLGFIGRHKYLFVTALFVLLIGFIDENCLLHRVEMESQISALMQEIRELRECNERDSLRLHRLTTDIREVRKVAREQYFMKRPGEDVYVFVDSTQQRIYN